MAAVLYSLGGGLTTCDAGWKRHNRPTRQIACLWQCGAVSLCPVCASGNAVISRAATLSEEERGSNTAVAGSHKSLVAVSSRKPQSWPMMSCCSERQTSNGLSCCRWADIDAHRAQDVPGTYHEQGGIFLKGPIYTRPRTRLNSLTNIKEQDRARYYVARSIMSVLLSIYIVLSPTR